MADSWEDEIDLPSVAPPTNAPVSWDDEVRIALDCVDSSSILSILSMHTNVPKYLLSHNAQISLRYINLPRAWSFHSFWTTNFGNWIVSVGVK